MNKPNNDVDVASIDSFPASDPPSSTPVTGCGNPHSSGVPSVTNLRIIRVPNGRGEELCHHLASHGIAARILPVAESSFEKVELSDDADLQDVQSILDQWER